MRNTMEKKKKVCANCYWYWGADTGCTILAPQLIRVLRPSKTSCEHYKDKNDG